MIPLLKIKSVTVAYDQTIALQDISLTLFQGDLMGIVGPNGGGKSTLLQAVLGLVAPQRGEISYYRNGETVKHLRMGYLPQKSSFDSHFPISVAEVVDSGLGREGRRLSARDRKERVADQLQQMQLEKLARRPIGQLSGGQLQRTLLGRALIGDPELLLLDEPTVFLDSRSQEQFFESISALRQKMTILFVSHQREELAQYANRIIEVNRTLNTLL